MFLYDIDLDLETENENGLFLKKKPGTEDVESRPGRAGTTSISCGDD